jgi:benzoate/toluate 1,2-dioxygenase reductase subunit
MSSHQVALSFEDGVTRFITCAEDQTVADASYRARINIPLDCRDGACGTCKAFCESGEYDGGFYIDDALAPDEAERGFVLPCSMKPKSDLVLQIASTSAVAKTRAATHTATLTQVERLSATTYALGVEIEDRESLAFLPGQYVNIDVPGAAEARSYSFSTSPDDKALGFLIKLTPGGVMSTWLSERAAVGEQVTFTGPNGSFFLRESNRPLLLLAGGTGLAPILSILRTLRDTGSTRPVHLVYGVSTDEDLVETARLEELAQELPQLTWDYCVSDPESSAPNKGYVTGLIRPEHLYDGDVAVYLCGPPPMVEAVRQFFAEQGVEPTGFYYEKFALSGTAPAPAVTAVEPAAGAEPEVAEEPAEVAVPAPAPSGREPATAAGQGTVVRAPLGAGAPRTIMGREVFADREVEPLHAGTATDAAAVADGARRIAGRVVFARPSPAPAPPPRCPRGTCSPPSRPAASPAVRSSRSARWLPLPLPPR